MKKFNFAMLSLASMPLLALAVVGSAADAKASAAPVARPAAFAVCAACHATEPGRTIVGPSLAGVAGRKAGSLPGYAYSEALKASGLTWDEATLDRWLTSPQKTVPGTKMPFMGIADPAKRREVVSYLMTLR